MKKIFAAALALPLLAAGLASAGEPVRLTDGQMDKVAAGGLSVQTLIQAAVATGTGLAATYVDGHAGTVEVAKITSGTSTLGVDLAGVYGKVVATN